MSCYESDAQSSSSSSSMAVNTLSYQDELYRPSAFRANPRRISDATTLSIGSKNMFPCDDDFYYSSDATSSAPSRPSWANRLIRIITLTKLTRALSRRRRQESRNSSLNFVGGSYSVDGKYLGLERHPPHQAHSHHASQDKFYYSSPPS